MARLPTEISLAANGFEKVEPVRVPGIATPFPQVFRVDDSVRQRQLAVFDECRHKLFGLGRAIRFGLYPLRADGRLRPQYDDDECLIELTLDRLAKALPRMQ